MPRPFEQLQFLRGTEAAYLDLADPPDAMVRFLGRMRDFYRRLIETWARTRVDGLMFMDDWGSQQNLLISPDTWREVFRPFYKDFVDIAHAAGKKAFMHSDGNILAIYSELAGLGLDAVNSQLFCMGVENLKPYAGKITFWGEIDRQHLLPHGTPGDISAAVREVRGTLWRGVNTSPSASSAGGKTGKCAPRVSRSGRASRCDARGRPHTYLLDEKNG